MQHRALRARATQHARVGGVSCSATERTHGSGRAVIGQSDRCSDERADASMTGRHPPTPPVTLGQGICGGVPFRCGLLLPRRCTVFQVAACRVRAPNRGHRAQSSPSTTRCPRAARGGLRHGSADPASPTSVPPGLLAPLINGVAPPDAAMALQFPYRMHSRVRSCRR